MKKLGLILMVMVFLSSISIPAFAGGDKNKHRHDGTTGKGETKTVRINK